MQDAYFARTNPSKGCPLEQLLSPVRKSVVQMTNQKCHFFFGNAHCRDSHCDTCTRHVSSHLGTSPTDGEIAAHKPHEPHDPVFMCHVQSTGVLSISVALSNFQDHMVKHQSKAPSAQCHQFNHFLVGRAFHT